jgi:hypothetical protein
VWPWVSSTRALDATRPTEEVLALGRHGATGFHLLPDPRSLDAIKRVLASGRTVIAAVELCEEHGWATGDAVITTPPLDCRSFHHSVLLVGYDDATQTFTILNSWGEGWGAGGYARVSYAFVRTRVHAGGYFQGIERAVEECDADPTPVVDRCAAIRGCADCTATSGCVLCDDACVASDPTGEVPATGSCSTPPVGNRLSCSLPPSGCGDHTDCGACAADDHCAWCGASGECVAWPEGAAYCEAGTRIAVDASQCNDATRACDAAPGCDACVALEGCTFCAGATSGECTGGDAITADRLRCERGTWISAGDMCPAPTPGACGPIASVCTEDTGCCEGLLCVESTCRDPAVCRVEAVPCEGLEIECCPQLSCLPSAIGGRAECCVGFDGGRCELETDCCGEMTCEDGQCRARAEGESCASANDCARSTMECIADTCTMP